MKKILLGTSALCAVAVAGPVSAQTANEPIKLGIGGFFHAGYGVILEQSGANGKNRRHDDIQLDNIVRFDGNTKLDNGITVGVSVQMRGQNVVPAASASPDFATATPDQVKRDFAYFRGSFGEFRVGDDDDARRQKAITAPVAGGGAMFGANTPDFLLLNIPGGLTNSTQKNLSTSKRVTRLAYFTPTIAGFSFNVSYAPGGTKGSNSGAFEPNSTPNQLGNIQNDISVAGAYTGKFGDFSLDAYLGYTHGDRATVPGTGGRDNPAAYSGGAVVGFGPFKVGGAYEFLSNASAPAALNAPHRDRSTWDVGGLYEIGPFGVSVDWTRGLYKNLVGGAGTGGASPTLDIVSLATDYKLGPGISVGAALDWARYNAHSTPGASISTTNYNGLSLVVGTAIGF